MELIEPFNNQIFNMVVESIKGKLQNICEAERTFVSKNYELHENHSLICTENIVDAEKKNNCKRDEIGR